MMLVFETDEAVSMLLDIHVLTNAGDIGVEMLRSILARELAGWVNVAVA